MLNDSFNAMRQFLLRLGPMAGRTSFSRWELDLSKCRYMGPDAAAVIAAIYLDAKGRGVDASVILPVEDKTRAFCHLSGLEHVLGQGNSPDTNHPAYESVPIRTLKQALYNDPIPVVSLIKRHMPLSQDSEDYLRICFSELTQNVEDHAKSPIGAVTVARYMTKKPQVRIAVVDRGEGIFNTLRRAHPGITTVSEALQKVIQGGYSSMSRPNNLGLGLSNMAAIVKAQGGEFTLFTDNAAVTLTKGRFDYSVGAWTFNGTAVFFSLPMV